MTFNFAEQMTYAARYRHLRSLADNSERGGLDVVMWDDKTFNCSTVRGEALDALTDASMAAKVDRMVAALAAID